MLNLIKFINDHEDWENLIQQEPYFITVKRKDTFIMFNYDQLHSDFYNPIVKECRGIILDDVTFEPVCVPFYQFGNYGEGYADKINWNTAKVQEKIDGSLIKVWKYDGEWHISTNGMIDARDAELNSDVLYKNFYNLFMIAKENSGLDFKVLRADCTYMFELISPFNKVVVLYDGVNIKHIGTRNNSTLQELDINVGVEKPKSFNFNSLNECIEMAKTLPFNQEGYVVVDENYNRVKVKSPAYVAASHLKNNGAVTPSRIIGLLRNGEAQEFLNYYPEYTNVFVKFENKIVEYIDIMDNEMDKLAELKIKEKTKENRKAFASIACKTICPYFLFSWYDDRCSRYDEWLWQKTDDAIVNELKL